MYYFQGELNINIYIYILYPYILRLINDPTNYCYKLQNTLQNYTTVIISFFCHILSVFLIASFYIHSVLYFSRCLT